MELSDQETVLAEGHQLSQCSALHHDPSFQSRRLLPPDTQLCIHASSIFVDYIDTIAPVASGCFAFKLESKLLHDAVVSLY